VAETVAEAFAVYAVGLVRFARQLVDDQETAEEVVQDVFLRLQAGRAVRPVLSHAYLRKAVLNQSRSVLRRRRLTRTKRLTGPLELVQSTDTLASQAVERDRVRRAVSALPRRQREVIVLRLYEDLPFLEIARTLGISPDAASSAYARALASIRLSLGADDE